MVLVRAAVWVFARGLVKAKAEVKQSDDAIRNFILDDCRFCEIKLSSLPKSQLDQSRRRYARNCRHIPALTHALHTGYQAVPVQASGAVYASHQHADPARLTRASTVPATRNEQKCE
jgi:hypothetical protein